MNLHLFRYNNYFNRTIVGKGNVTLAAFGTPVLSVDGVNDFCERDGVNTSHTINLVPYNVRPDLAADYLVVADEYNNVVSRWFIIDGELTRKGQYVVSLRRDLVAESWDEVRNAPAFIEKATVDDSSPLIFNSENFVPNMIKKDERLVRDFTNSGWIVGYYDKNAQAAQLSGTVDTGDTYGGAIDIGVPIASWKYYGYRTSDFIGAPQNVYYQIRTKDSDYNLTAGLARADFTTRLIPISTSLTHSGQVAFTTTLGELARAAGTYGDSESWITAARTDIDHESGLDTLELVSFNNKIIKDSSGSYYEVKVTNTAHFNGTYYDATLDSTIGGLMNSAFTTGGALRPRLTQYGGLSGTPNSTSYRVRYDYDVYRVTLTALPALAATWDLTTHVNTTDAEYNVFCIPYGDALVKTTNWLISTSTDFAIALAQSIATTMGGTNGVLYDLQLLPYFPFADNPDILNPLGYLDFSTGDLSGYTHEVKRTEGGVTTYYGVIIDVPRTKISFDIDYVLDSTDGIDQPLKVRSTCYQHRLCSPNYSGAFDFSVARNGGLDGFNVDMTLFPISPYIHINPKFGGLYGRDFNDARGLICGGDFSLPIVTDAWISYQIANKNYQNSFDRQIESLEFNNKWNRTNDIWSAVAGAFGGVSGGAVAGNFIGGPAGSVVGGIVGGAISAVAGAKDVEINQKLREESLDLTKDQFGFQLGNIQALPHSLSKVGAFNNNNKIWPFIEIYAPTDTEIQAFKNKLTYNGMTVGVIGTIDEYLREDPSYIRARLIRVDGLDVDTHWLNELAQELNLGVYV